MSARLATTTSAVLWVAAPLLAALTWYRPFTETHGLAEMVPAQLAGHRMAAQHQMTDREFELLGTTDAVWRTYVDDGKNEIYLVALFHQENWKSVHPPRICLEGSDMTIVEEGELEISAAPSRSVGRILARSRGNGADYLSLYVYGAGGFLTPSYTEFFLHHAPSAVLRRSTGGFLVRVESFVGTGGVAEAEERCAAFMRQLIPACGELLER